MKRLKQDVQTIYYQLDKILLLFGVMFMFLEWIWLPFNTFISEKLLTQTGYLYLSYDNIWSVFGGHWWVGLSLFLLLLVNLSLSYCQIVLIFIGIRRLLGEQGDLRTYCWQVSQDFYQHLKTMRPTKVIFSLFYLVVLFPFWGRLLHLYFFNKLIIPQFILDYLQSNYYIALIFLLLGLLFAYLAIRLMFALPMLIYDNHSVRGAIASSWKQTKNFWRHVWSLLHIYLSALAFLLSAILLATLSQALGDKAPDWLSFIWAVVNYVLMKWAWYLTLGFLLVRVVSYLQGQELGYERQGSLHLRLRFFILVASSILFIGQAMTYYLHPYDSMPKTISHRGVTDGNGVQNTIAALEETAKLKPDYVEIDLQETGDRQFVVMHDQNLSNLAGVDGTTHDFSLAELTKMTVSENGYTTSMSSFDDYLAKAEQLQQKLLIELKTNKEDSPEMVKTFLTNYGQQIKARGHLIQSLDYRVIEQVKRFDNKLPAYFVLPYNSIYPRTRADGYVMEYSSLTQSFVNKVWRQGKQTFAWTANDADTVEKLLTMEVDGIITDRLEETQRVLKDNLRDKNYLDLFLRFVTELTVNI